MNTVTEGKMVHFVTDTGEHRAALIVRNWETPDGKVNLQAFWDGQNDLPMALTHGDGNDPSSITSVPFGEDATPGTWHWIELAQHHVMGIRA